MIKSAMKGDLIQLFKQRHFDAIAHGCNIYCQMGSGIALDIKNNFPVVYTEDCRTVSGDRSKLGTFTYVGTSYGHIYSCYTQATYWNPSDMFSYDALEDAMRSVSAHMRFCDMKRLGIPCLGAVRARGEWDKIAEIIDKCTPDIDVTVVVWENETNKKILDWYNSFMKGK